MDNSSPMNRITIKDAMLMWCQAWECVSTQTIVNCWHHCKILPLALTINSTMSDDSTAIDDTAGMQAEFIPFIDVDLNEPTRDDEMRPMTDEQIVDKVLGIEQSNSIDDEEEDIEVEIKQIIAPTLFTKHATEMIDFLEAASFDSYNYIRAIRAAQQHVTLIIYIMQQQALQQQSLLAYFKPSN